MENLEKNELLKKIQLNEKLKDEIIKEEIEKYKNIIYDEITKDLDSKTKNITAEEYYKNKYKYPFIPSNSNNKEPIASNDHIYEELGDTNCSYLKLDDIKTKELSSNIFSTLNE